MMTDDQIDALVQRAKQGGVFWHDGDNCIAVRGVKRNWIEYDGAPAEPAAALANGKYVALNNVAATEFVTMVPAFSTQII